MNLQTLDTILTTALPLIPIASYVLGLGYMIWKEI